jgi:type II secretory ATPase GspE/PulE/Tfp pilus assembly ATPase PilB-like protein
MKIKELGGIPLIQTVFGIIADGIKRDAMSIRIRVGKKHLEVFEKKESNGPMEQVARASLRLSTSVIARLKIIGNLSISEHRRVQIGSYNFNFDGTPAISRKVRVICIPDLNGNEEIIIDLVHN